MQLDQDIQRTDTDVPSGPGAAAARPVPATAAAVGPLGGIVFSAACLGAYVAVVAALVVS